VNGDLIACKIVVDEETSPFVDCEFLSESCTHAHCHGADHLASSGLGIENPSRSANSEHPADARLTGGGIDGDLDEMGPKG